MSVTTAGRPPAIRSARIARSLVTLLAVAAMLAMLALTSFSAPSSAASPRRSAAAHRIARAIHASHATSLAARTVRVRSAAAGMKAVIVVGPVGSSTPTFIKKANAIARAALDEGMDVVKIYPPNATWERVVAEANGANLFVYLGHGNGWPSGMGPFQEDTKDGLGLSPAPDTTNLYLTKYYGANLVRANIQLARNAVVILNKLCYAEGNAQPGMALPTTDVARQRVDNFASGFLASGARVVFALGWQPGENIVTQLFDPEPQTMDDIFMTRFGQNADGSYKPYYGWIGWKPSLYFDSVRTPGARNHLDPDKDEGFLRAVTGDLDMTNEQFLGDIDLTDQDPPVLTDLSGDQATNTLPAAAGSLPMFTPNGDGLSDTLTMHFSVSEAAFVTVQVNKTDGTQVRRFTRWAQAGAGTATWDGLTDAGRRAKDGKYEVLVSARDRAGNQGAPDRMMIKVLTALRAPTVAPDAFWPTDGDALAQTATFSATLSQRATVTWRIVNQVGDTIRTGIDAADLPAGPVTWTWDGTNDAGEAQRVGSYVAVVTTTTDAGTYSHTAPVRLAPFFLKAKVDVSAGDRQNLLLVTTEPVKGVPAITVKQPGRAAYALSVVRISPTRFRAVWTVPAGRAGKLTITVSATDTGGGTDQDVFPGTIH
ncbi:MAG: FlgD immunoglobulin-like domain containing protein [Chloroflexota bacterium]